MAQLVMGVGTSHSPQLSIRWDRWNLLREKDETDPRIDYAGLLKRAKPDIEADLAVDKWRERDAACQRAIGVLGDVLRAARPDAVVVVGDDQHEQFYDDNMPVVALYHGDSIPIVRHHVVGDVAHWKAAEEQGWAETADRYQAATPLADHLIRALIDEEFDVTRTNRLREEVGVGHAFSFLYRRILPGSEVPMVPLMVNTYYPPNQPTPKRCYNLGRALRKAIESWDSDQRVAVMASGGLSHVIIDEDLDRTTIDALQQRDEARLWDLPRQKLRGGTSEILNWVVLAGAVEPFDMTLVDYVPTYRSPAGTGCGMTFAYWQ
jgi:hypothetical protein